MNDNNTRQQNAVRRATPWWANIIVAIACYCTLKYLIPALHPKNPALLKFSEAAPAFAPLVAIPFLLLAAKRLYDTDRVDSHHEETDSDDERSQGE